MVTWDAVPWSLGMLIPQPGYCRGLEWWDGDRGRSRGTAAEPQLRLRVLPRGEILLWRLRVSTQKSYPNVLRKGPPSLQAQQAGEEPSLAKQ